MAYIEGSDSADRFVQIFHLYQDKMMRIAESILHNYYDAEDAVQAAFFAISRNIDKLPDASSKATEIYVCKCAKNAALNMLPSKKLRDNLLDIDEQDDLSYENTYEQYMSEENYRLIVEAIKEIPEKYRDVLSLYYIYEMKPGEIASSLGQSVETVKSRIKRGKAILIKNLKERTKHDQ